MSDQMMARFRRWFEYERDAHAKVFKSLETVPAERRSGAEYRKAVNLLGHLTGARRIWLERLGVVPRSGNPLFPEDAELRAVAAEWLRVADAWDAYLTSLADPDLDREFEYQSFDGGRFRNRVEDILAQMYGHSWYHRGQIAVLVRAAGGVPAATDLVYWCREPVG